MKKYKAKLVELGLDFKKEISVLIIFNLVLLGGSILLGALYNWYFAIIAVPLMALYTYYFFFRYKSIEKKRSKEMQDELIYILSYFKIYIQNGYSVYSAIKETSTFTNGKLKEKIDELIKDIDEDKSVTPFIKFAKNFQLLSVEQLMISIYQMIDEGTRSEYLKQFQLMFDDLENDLYQSYLIKKDNSLQMASIYPLIGAGMLVLIITMGIIGVIGDMVNGL